MIRQDHYSFRVGLQLSHEKLERVREMSREKSILIEILRQAAKARGRDGGGQERTRGRNVVPPGRDFCATIILLLSTGRIRSGFGIYRMEDIEAVF